MKVFHKNCEGNSDLEKHTTLAKYLVSQRNLPGNPSGGGAMATSALSI